LPELVAHTERLAGRKGYLPLMLGAVLANARGDKRFLSLKVNVKPRMQKVKEAAKALWKRNGAVVFAVAALVFAGVDGLLLKNNAVLNGFLAMNKERTGTQIPAYLSLIKEEKTLKALDETVLRPIDDHTFVIAASNLVSRYAGNIAVMSFEYRAAERTVVIELECASYDVMSVFLKNIRDDALFAKVSPVSSDTVKTGGSEAIHFKVELVR